MYICAYMHIHTYAVCVCLSCVHGCICTHPSLCTRSGHFLVRPSQDADAFAISFRTSPESSVVHWKVTREGGKYTIHPRPHKYNNLQEVVVVSECNSRPTLYKILLNLNRKYPLRKAKYVLTIRGTHCHFC